MEYIHGGNKMLKLSLKQGQYVNIGDNIRVVYVGDRKSTRLNSSHSV